VFQGVCYIPFLSSIAEKNNRLRKIGRFYRPCWRLSESTGREAKTIHRLLEADPRSGAFRRTEETPLDCDLLVITAAT